MTVRWALRGEWNGRNDAPASGRIDAGAVRNDERTYYRTRFRAAVAPLIGALYIIVGSAAVRM